MPLVTVSIPTCNRRTYLRAALESVRAQTFQDFRVLISDNGSIDGTADLVAEFAKHDPRIELHRFPANVGLARNMRFAIATPETELVAFLPDDDLWLPHHLERAVDALTSVPDAVLYGCTARFFGADSGHGYHRPCWIADCRTRHVLDTRRSFVPWLKESPMAPASVVFVRRAREGVDWESDDTFGPMDWLWWGQMALRGLTIFDPAVGVKIRWHQGNQSQTLLKGIRARAQSHYVSRRLATLAVEAGAIVPAGLVDEVSGSWPLRAAADLVVALACCDAPAALRRAALEIFNRKPGLRTSQESARHCRLAHRVGPGYLGVADIVDRVLGRWWKPGLVL